MQGYSIHLQSIGIETVMYTLSVTDAINDSIFLFDAGVVIHYVLTRLSLWILFHVVAVFWAVQFPFHARAFKKMNKHSHWNGYCRSLSSVCVSGGEICNRKVWADWVSHHPLCFKE